MRIPSSISVPSLALALAALLAVGCGGSSSPSGPASGAPSVSRLAVGPQSDAGIPATGFDAAGRPAFVAVQDDYAKWKVFSSSEALLYEIPVPADGDSRPGAVSGRFVVGDYLGADGAYGVLVASRADDGTVTTRAFPGLLFSVCDGGRALVYDSTTEGSPAYSLLDLATGSLTPAPLPAGSAPYAMRGRYALCTLEGGDGGRKPGRKAGSRSPGGMVLVDLEGGSSTPLRAPEGTDGRVYAYVLNAKGQALGVTYAGEGSQMRLWNASGAPGPVLESVAGGSLDPGWLSEDGRKMTFTKDGGGTRTAYMRVGAKAYALTSEAFPLGSLYGLNAEGTLGFGHQPDLDAEVAVSVSYR